MNKLFSTLFSSIRAKFTRIWTRVRMWTSPAFLRARVFGKVRQFFSKLFDVRPRHKRDYYPMALWLVSKRLAFAAVVVLGVLCAFYLYTTLPKNFFGGGGDASLRTYKYNSIPLKFYDGTVRILGGDGHLAYQGQVSKAACNGLGTLYDRDGVRVYEGAFADDRYNGDGTLYYKDGAVQYQGGFVDNLFQGQGEFYRPNGTIEYQGEHLAGHRNGTGRLYNAGANPIFNGTFLMDQIVYGEFLGKQAADVAKMYTGNTSVYSTAREYAVSMEEIGAVYSAADGTNSLEGGFTTDSVYVLSGAFPIQGEQLTSVNQLSAYFGEPDYFGTSWMNLPEAVAANLLAQQDPKLLGTVPITAEQPFDGVYTVTQYDQGTDIYIYTYLRDGLLYTFYTAGAGQDSFVMYAIEIT